MNVKNLVLSEDMKNELRQLWNVPSNKDNEKSSVLLDKRKNSSPSETGW